MVAGLELQNQSTFTERDLALPATLGKLEDIGSLFRDHRRDPGDTSRLVGHDHPEFAEASIVLQATADDTREQLHVDIAATDDNNDLLSIEILQLVVVECRKADSTRAFCERFLSLEQ